MMVVYRGDARGASGSARPAGRRSLVAWPLMLATFAFGCGTSEEAPAPADPQSSGGATTAPAGETPEPVVPAEVEDPAVPGAAMGGGAMQAAERWLVLVDRGRYAESWDEAAAYFKGAVPQDQWIGQVRGVRAPLGAVQSRALQSAQPATSLPGAPDGSYVVIQFRTAFANKESSVETVTPMLDPDGTWRVSGYFIR